MLVQPGKVNHSARLNWSKGKKYKSPWVGSKCLVRLFGEVPAPCGEGLGGERDVLPLPVLIITQQVEGAGGATSVAFSLLSWCF